jgi:hypothetical protein
MIQYNQLHFFVYDLYDYDYSGKSAYIGVRSAEHVTVLCFMTNLCMNIMMINYPLG